MWKCPKCGKRVDDLYEICWACGTSVDGVENPGFLEEGNLGKGVDASVGPEADVRPESLVTLTKCSMAGQAHAIRVRLESEGIPVFLFDEFTISMDWLLSNAIGGVKVQVPEPYLARAQAILGIVEAEQEMREQVAETEESHEDDPNDKAAPAVEEGVIDKEKQPPTSDEERIVEKQDEA